MFEVDLPVGEAERLHYPGGQGGVLVFHLGQHSHPHRLQAIGLRTFNVLAKEGSFLKYEAVVDWIVQHFDFMLTDCSDQRLGELVLTVWYQVRLYFPHNNVLQLKGHSIDAVHFVVLLQSAQQRQVLILLQAAHYKQFQRRLEKQQDSVQTELTQTVEGQHHQFGAQQAPNERQTPLHHVLLSHCEPQEQQYCYFAV